MPLKKGKSKKVFNENVDELLAAFDRKSAIGNVKPKNREKARKTALAIAFGKKREGK